MPSVTTITMEERDALIESLSDDELQQAYAALREILPGFDPDDDDDPLIDMPMIAKLAGVAPGTPGAWQQRTREGTERVPFPEAGDPRYTDKPQWFAVSQIVAGFLKPSGRWPRGSVARVSTRAGNQPRLSYAQLITEDAELAKDLAKRGLTTGTRTLQGWRGLRTRRARRA